MSNLIRRFQQILKGMGVAADQYHRPSAHHLTGFEYKGGQFVFRPLPSAERRWQQALAENKVAAWLDYVRHWLQEREPENERLAEALDRAEELAGRSGSDPAELAALKKQIAGLRQEIASLKREKLSAELAQQQAEAQAATTQNTLSQLQAELKTRTAAQEQLRAELAQARQAGGEAYERAARQVWEEHFSKTSSLEELDRFLRWFPSGSLAEQARALQDKLRGFSLPEMVRVEGGSFLMGSDEYNNAKPLHRVRLNSFEIGKYPVTQRQWQEIMGENPSRFKVPEHPVESVSREDVLRFLKKLNEKTGRAYRLPTEAEWEYAAGGGAEKRTKWAGTDDEKALGEYAWYDANSDSVTNPVGQKKPNQLGLYDMSGNVWEWCLGRYHGNYTGAPADGSAWENPAGFYWVFRGGSWFDRPAFCRVAYCYYGCPGFRSNRRFGFRLARTP